VVSVVITFLGLFGWAGGPGADTAADVGLEHDQVIDHLGVSDISISYQARVA